MNYYPFHIGDYLSHTAHLTCLEDIAYRRLIDLYYLRESPIPDVDAARLVRMQEHADEVSSVLREFFDLDDGVWRHGRCDDEIAKMADKRDKARSSAAASVAARRRSQDDDDNGRSTDAQRTLNGRSTDAELPTPTPTPTPNQEEDLAPTAHSRLAAPKRPAVPVQEIIDAYHELLPFGSACRKITAKRKAAISARWNSGDLPDLETWREYFERAAKSKFIRGEVAPTIGHRQFQVSIDYLIREDSYAKALENTGAFKW